MVIWPSEIYTSWLSQFSCLYKKFKLWNKDFLQSTIITKQEFILYIILICIVSICIYFFTKFYFKDYFIYMCKCYLWYPYIIYIVSLSVLFSFTLCYHEQYKILTFWGFILNSVIKLVMEFGEWKGIKQYLTVLPKTGLSIFRVVTYYLK